MRLDRYQPWAEQTLTDAKDTSVQGIEPGMDEVSHGSRITMTNGAQLHVQWVRTAPPSGDGSGEDEKIVTGEAPALVDVPSVPGSGKIPTTDLERHLAALLNNGANPELISVTGYTQEAKLGGERQPYGVRVLCHSGAIIYGLFRQTLSAGQQPTRESDFKQQEFL